MGMKLQKNLNKIIILTVCLLMFLLYVFPFFLILINSFKSRLEVVEDPLSLPKSFFDFSNFIEAFQTMNYGSAVINSLIITIVSVVVIILFSSMLAYYLVRHDSKLSKVIFMSLVASMIIPFQSVMIPFVTIFGNLGLLNSRGMLIYFYLGFGISMATFMFHGFLKSIPVELEEAAIIDGASRLQVFFKIVLPMLKPTTATIAILDVLWVWNDFLLPSLVLVNDNVRTLPLSTFYFFGKYTADYSVAMAALVLVLLPVLIFYFIMQKRIIAGVVDGAIK
ncbi:raffinose/stachyose/melibiose transport system permease protein [Enterococcus sp. PF1-24]|uniref:carbohydrate ABC transporter permease n=1 Tax=unclassified Enterococcus TaxID=2608891 RepID=UPI00247338DD|nr:MULTISPECIES: carbohydrate ABC transporter permease [unclassified Enterococcus]MDH6363784.1 raffinose/stachyose/melibiose transport system permease protein [Enterococcus sp. PFB1-1]MDH6400740.1 raffinose/stachyose/melibiose transport system permease protein [Enterococcus sp. PF1-24]